MCVVVYAPCYLFIAVAKHITRATMASTLAVWPIKLLVRLLVRASVHRLAEADVAVVAGEVVAGMAAGGLARD